MGFQGWLAYLTQSQTSPGEREGTLEEVQLAEVREAHWKALATTMALEEEIEQLSHSITQDHHGTHVPSWESGLEEKEVLGAEYMALQGPTREQPSPFPNMQPAAMAA